MLQKLSGPPPECLRLSGPPPECLRLSGPPPERLRLSGPLEEPQIEAAEAPGDPKLTRRVTTAQKATEELYRDMHGVLSSLAQQCAMAKLSITDFIPAEEAASLTQTAHE